MATPASRELLRKLDRDFIGITSINDDVYKFQSSDVEVANVLTLAFPVALPNTVVSYSFTTKKGNIQFGVKFKDEAKKETILTNLGWFDSDTRTIEGTFTLENSGTILFSWDNTRQSWVSTKRLTYSIQLRQEAFMHEDVLRSEKALSILPAAREEKDILLVRLGRKQEVERDIFELKEQIDEIQRKIKNTKKEKQKINEKVLGVKKKIRFYKERVLGLSIRLEIIYNYVSARNYVVSRSLEAKLLRRIFTFIDPNFENPKVNVAFVCKYWRVVVSHKSLSAGPTKANLSLMKSPKAVKPKRSGFHNVMRLDSLKGKIF